MKRDEFVKIAKIAFHKWQAHNATIRAAALAFFTILPLPSLLLILLEIYALIYGQAQALQQLTRQVTLVAGPTVADIINELLGGQINPLNSGFGSVITVVFAGIGAISAFAVLQDSLNGI